ncbi:NADP-dependent oxidoreductase [Streptomyces fuscigenes]|uniref:NADP-dependent oxidoreductase n=1 Tax=Streptomyces fuscigenes TaxID=1528880 RepID=UPI001F2BAD20|nr:NADP-dependent oxidoreductase [Streptomyces fuscigenes]MCF3963229.1 NADP-dependent oxidoreductase [Streptomyces fuscigenes]
MRAATVTRFGGPEAVEITEHPTPVPGPGQVRIRVGAAALNPVDAAMRSGVFGGEGPVGLGFDVAGTVDAAGAGTRWTTGERVIALATGHHKPLGTHADHIVLDDAVLAPAPRTLDDIHAATLPLNTTTASQALRLLSLSPGQSLLVTGAAGGVGAHTVELAHRQGLKVTGLDADVHEEFLLSRGADHFLARGQQPSAGGFDGVLDAARLGADALAAVRDGGAYAGLWPGQEPRSERGIRVEALAVRADGALLAELSRLADLGVLRARVERTYPLRDAAEAHARLAEGGLRGRIVLVP